MHALALHILRRFHHGLTERWVRVDRVHQLFDCGLQLDRDTDLVDQVAGVGADNACAEDLAVLLLGDDLDLSDRFVDRQGLAEGLEREAADLDIVALVLCLDPDDLDYTTDGLEDAEVAFRDALAELA